jgi:hypothetical protein
MTERERIAELEALPLETLRAELERREAEQGITSAEFFDRWLSGLAGDIPDPTEWYFHYVAAVLKGFPAPPDYVASIKAVREGPRHPVVVLTPDRLKEELAKREAEYGMTSAEFYSRWKAGQAGDSQEAFYWAFLCDVAVHEGLLARPDRVRA